MTGSGSLIEVSGGWRGIDSSQFLAGAMDIEQPLDPSPFGVASTLPMREFAAKRFAVFNTPVQALLAQYPDFNLHHIEPARVLGHEVKLQPAQHIASEFGSVDFIECRGFVCREIIEHHPHRLGIAIVNWRAAC